MLRHEPIEGPMPYTPEWYAFRQYDELRDPPVVFGASDAAAICGNSEYRTPAHVFLSQTQPQEQQEDADHLWFGKAVEPVIIGRYQEKTGRMVVAPVPMFFHPVHRFIAATPDAITLDSKWRKHDFPIDAKSTGFRMADKWGEEGTDEVPIDVLMQAQQQMLVMGADHQETIQLLLSSRSIRIYPIERNQDLCDAIVEAGRELSERIIANDPPEPNWTHPKAREINKALFGLQSAIRRQADAEFQLAREAYKMALEAEKEAVKAKEAAKGKMEWLMGDAAFMDLGDGKEMVRSVIRVPEQVRKAYEYTSMRERKVPK